MSFRKAILYLLLNNVFNVQAALDCQINNFAVHIHPRSCRMRPVRKDNFTDTVIAQLHERSVMERGYLGNERLNHGGIQLAKSFILQLFQNQVRGYAFFL